jgi:hypothetical protein
MMTFTKDQRVRVVDWKTRDHTHHVQAIVVDPDVMRAPKDIYRERYQSKSAILQHYVTVHYLDHLGRIIDVLFHVLNRKGNIEAA